MAMSTYAHTLDPTAIANLSIAAELAGVRVSHSALLRASLKALVLRLTEDPASAASFV